MQNFSERLFGARTAKGWSAQQLANESGVSLRSIQKWESEDPGVPQPAKLRKVAQSLGVSIAYLMGTEGGQLGGSQLRAPEKTTDPKARIQRIPVVSWARAGQGGNFGDLANQIEEWLPSDCPDPNAYALIIEGDSMVPNYLPGDRVIFLPNSEARNGDIVVARLGTSGDVYFKLFHRVGPDSKRVRLSSYNTIYPALEFDLEDFRFIHPMYGFFRRGRR